MISFENAHEIVMGTVPARDVEQVSLSESLNRILAEPVKADVDMPPFSRSAMDGYACRKSDLSNPLVIIEEIAAGHIPEKKLSVNQCAKIMTGAPVPDGSDWVVRVEHTRVDEKGYVHITDPGKVSNIRYQGEDKEEDEVIIGAGTRIRQQHIGIMAMVGNTKPVVYQKPEVGIIATGSELVPPERTPGISQIRNSNGPQLEAQLRDIGIQANQFGIATDRRDEMTKMIKMAVDQNHVVLISGGVSAGDYDFVPELLESAGFDIKFHKMKVRPGKPLLFAVTQDRYVFGIPGNPVSTFVQFEMLIKPFLFNFMGCQAEIKKYKMVMATDYQHLSSSLRYFLPARFDRDGVWPVTYHGSGHLASYVIADGILEIPPGKEFIKKGEAVYVRPI